MEQRLCRRSLLSRQCPPQPRLYLHRRLVLVSPVFGPLAVLLRRSPHAAVGTLRPAAAACVQTTLCGSAATHPLLPCPADGRTGRFGSTRTRPPSQASAAASTAPTSTAPPRSSPHGRNAAAVPLPEAWPCCDWGLHLLYTRGIPPLLRLFLVSETIRKFDDLSSQSKWSACPNKKAAESDAKQRFLFHVQCAQGQEDALTHKPISLKRASVSMNSNCRTEKYKIRTVNVHQAQHNLKNRSNLHQQWHHCK